MVFPGEVYAVGGEEVARIRELPVSDLKLLATVAIEGAEGLGQAIAHSIGMVSHQILVLYTHVLVDVQSEDLTGPTSRLTALPYLYLLDVTVEWDGHRLLALELDDSIAAAHFGSPEELGRAVSTVVPCFDQS